MMENTIAYIAGDVTIICRQKKINERLLYVPQPGPESTFHTVDVGVALPKGSNLRPYLNFV